MTIFMHLMRKKEWRHYILLKVHAFINKHCHILCIQYSTR